MGTTIGTVRQKFKILVDIDKLMEYITNSILERINTEEDINSVDLDEYYIEDDCLVITGTYDTNFKSYYSPATRWEPAEEDMRRFYIGEDGVGLLDSVPKEIVDLIRIYKVVEDEDDAHYKESEPDEDAIYDAWKDRQLEED